VVVVHRAHGLRFIIYIDDHEPAHVHVQGNGAAKIDLLGASGSPELVYSVGMTRADQRRMLREVGRHQAMLLARWRDIHG
jgi:hypothetical protein